MSNGLRSCKNKERNLCRLEDMGSFVCCVPSVSGDCTYEITMAGIFLMIYFCLDPTRIWVQGKDRRMLLWSWTCHRNQSIDLSNARWSQCKIHLFLVLSDNILINFEHHAFFVFTDYIFCMIICIQHTKFFRTFKVNIDTECSFFSVEGHCLY